MEVLCSHPVHTVQGSDCVIADRVITVCVLACRHEVTPTTHNWLEARGQGNRGASHQPGVPTVGGLLIVCDLALVGAKVQAQSQIGSSFHTPSPVSGMPDSLMLNPGGRVRAERLACPFSTAESFTKVGGPWAAQLSMKKF